MATVSDSQAQAIEVSPAQARELVEQGAQLIDVREQREWDAGRIAGARHIELQQLPAAAEMIDREQPVIFQCRSGVRSLMAAEAFRAAGYEAVSMAGGLLRWVDDGLALEPADGRVADH